MIITHKKLTSIYLWHIWHSDLHSIEVNFIKGLSIFFNFTMVHNLLHIMFAVAWAANLFFYKPNCNDTIIVFINIY